MIELIVAVLITVPFSIGMAEIIARTMKRFGWWSYE
jgi:hypothetical protein